MTGRHKAIFAALLLCSSTMLGSIATADVYAWKWATIPGAPFRPVADWLGLAVLFGLALWSWQVGAAKALTAQRPRPEKPPAH